MDLIGSVSVHTIECSRDKSGEPVLYTLTPLPEGEGHMQAFGAEELQVVPSNTETP